MAHSSIRGSTESTPPKRPGEPSSARVDAALPLDEPVQGLGIQLVDGRVSERRARGAKAGRLDGSLDKLEAFSRFVERMLD